MRQYIPPHEETDRGAHDYTAKTPAGSGRLATWHAISTAVPESPAGPGNDYRYVQPRPVSAIGRHPSRRLCARCRTRSSDGRRARVRPDYRGRASRCTQWHAAALRCISLTPGEPQNARRRGNRQRRRVREGCAAWIRRCPSPARRSASVTRTSCRASRPSPAGRRSNSRTSIRTFITSSRCRAGRRSISADSARARRENALSRSPASSRCTATSIRRWRRRFWSSITALYATPASNGSFTIGSVSPGTYQLSAWHERIGETTKPIKVVAGEDASVEFALPVVEK